MFSVDGKPASNSVIVAQCRWQFQLQALFAFLDISDTDSIFPCELSSDQRFQRGGVLTDKLFRCCQEVP